MIRFENFVYVVIITGAILVMIELNQITIPFIITLWAILFVRGMFKLIS